jgi:PST family polysaccharide transporter/lipopolysaccharide exporter
MREYIRAIIGKMTPSGSIGERAIKSSIWLIGQNVLDRGLQLLTLLILGRILGPRAIGLIGVSLLTLAAMEEFTSIGLKDALVQREADNVDEYLNTTWVLETTRGLIVAVVVLFAAPLIANVLGEPRATDIIRVIGFSALVLGLKNPGVIYFQKNLDYHKQFLYQTSGSVVQFLVAVGYVLVIPSVWGYVFGYIAGNVARLTVSYLAHDFRPGLQFDTQAARDMISFGKWITGSSIVYFLYNQGDDAFIAWFLGPAPLALYQYAYRFSNAPATEFTQVLGRVMFPTYSKFQNDIPRVRSTFMQSFRFSALIAVPMAFGIVVVAPSFVRAVLGSSWVDMIPAMQILAIYGLLRALGRNFSPVWKALGRPDLTTKIGIVRVVTVAIFIYPATEAFGITGAALVITGLYIVPIFPIDIYFVAKMIDGEMTTIYAELVYPLVAGGLMASAAWWVGDALTVAAPFKFVAVLLTGLVTYPAAVLLLEGVFNWGIRQEITMFVNGVRS